MGRRTFLKGAVVGTGAVATGIGKEAFGGEGSLPAKVDKSPKPKAATATTRTANAKLLGRLPFASKQDMEDATRGLIAPLPNNGVITNEKGEPVWDMRKFQFILDQEKAPDTVNPSLWRQSRLVMQGGLFKVVDGLYQVRNADLSNGKSGGGTLLSTPATEAGGCGRTLAQPRRSLRRGARSGIRR
jgi:alkyl sulfatase BDS1-like metallo-beta-lactamase superfamily hydrolase